MAFAIFTFKSILRRQKKKNYGKLKYLFHHAQKNIIFKTLPQK
jgi:hypothetical protein